MSGTRQPRRNLSGVWQCSGVPTKPDAPAGRGDAGNVISTCPGNSLLARTPDAGVDVLIRHPIAIIVIIGARYSPSSCVAGNAMTGRGNRGENQREVPSCNWQAVRSVQQMIVPLTDRARRRCRQSLVLRRSSPHCHYRHRQPSAVSGVRGAASMPAAWAHPRGCHFSGMVMPPQTQLLQIACRYCSDSARAAADLATLAL